MAGQIAATIRVTDWVEQAIGDADATPKLSHASAKTHYADGFDGGGSVNYLMTYLESGRVPFVGLESVVCEVGSRKGSFVLEYRGEYNEKGLTADATVVADSGTGDFASVEGSGQFVWPAGTEEGRLTLDLV